jgi:DNA-binding MarR family transcriptional regulator
MSESQASPLIHAMRTLQSALEDHDRAVSAACDLGRSDWRCLQYLVANGAQSPRALQRRLGLTSGSVTALLDRLERRGLIERQPDPADRRALLVVPLAAAQHVVREASDPLECVARKLAQRWGSGRSDAAGQACLDLARLVEWSAQRV